MSAAGSTADALASASTPPGSTNYKTLNAQFLVIIAGLMLIALGLFDVSNRMTRVETQIDGYRADMVEMRRWIRAHDKHAGD